MTLPTVIYRSLKELIIEALHDIQNLYSQGSVLQNVSQRLSINGPGSASLSGKVKPDLSHMIIKVEQSLEKGSTFVTFGNAVENDPKISKQLNTLVGTIQGQRRWTTNDVFRMVLTQYLEQTDNNLVFQENIFGSICTKLQESFTSTEVSLHSVSFLENMEMEDKVLSLEQGIVIRQLEPHEVETMWNNNPWLQEYYPFYGVHTIRPSALQVLVETRRLTPKIVGDHKHQSVDPKDMPTTQVGGDFRDVVSALRILKRGTVRLGPIASSTEGFLGLGTSITGLATTAQRPRGVKYILKSSEVDEFKNIWSMLRSPKVSKNRALSVGIRRLNFAIDRISWEDTLIDTIIALEALVLSDLGNPQERGELRFRLAIRVAHLLRGDVDEMLGNYKSIKKAYDLRSKVAHGGVVKQVDTGSVDESLDLCRRSVRELLLLHTSGKKPDWDRWLFKEQSY